MHPVPASAADTPPPPDPETSTTTPGGCRSGHLYRQVAGYLAGRPGEVSGRFLSVDPILQQKDPTQISGYDYSGNNPTTRSDPTGLDSCATGGQGCVWDDNCHCYLPFGSDDSGNPPTTTDTHSGGASGKSNGGGNNSSGSNSSKDGGYTYTYSEDLGPLSEIGSAKYAMDIFKEYPDKIFPFPITGCSVFKDGETCTLHPGPATVNGVGDVYVTTTDTSVTFTVVSDNYFDAPGSKITFSIVNRNGELYLSQHAEATKTRLPAKIGVDVGYVKQTWRDQAHNLRLALRTGPSHPHIDWTSPTDWADLVTGNWGHWF